MQPRRTRIDDAVLVCEVRSDSVDMVLSLARLYDGLALDPNPFTDVENGNSD